MALNVSTVEAAEVFTTPLVNEQRKVNHYNLRGFHSLFLNNTSTSEPPKKQWWRNICWKVLSLLCFLGVTPISVVYSRGKEIYMAAAAEIWQPNRWTLDSYCSDFSLIRKGYALSSFWQEEKNYVLKIKCLWQCGACTSWSFFQRFFFSWCLQSMRMQISALVFV